ncbi:hypothetical protein WAI453_002235 [Rhynchosporium graminicola]
MRLTNFLSLFALVSATAVQAEFSQYLSEIPECGIQCILQILPTSVCGLTNETCICENEDVAARTQSCLVQNCTVLESFQVANITALGCGREHPDRSRDIIYTTVLGAFAVLCVIMRMISRWEEGGFNPDDYFMAFAGLCMIPLLTTGDLSAKYAFGRNIWDIPTNHIVLGLQFFYWGEICYFTVLGACKMSILMFYLRIFPSQAFRNWCFSLLGVVTMAMVVFQLMTLFQCWPISYNWHGWKGEMQGKCLNIQAFNYASSAVNIILDFAILILPLPWLIRLKVGLKRKLSIIFMFSIGIFIFIVSVLRINFVNKFKASVNPTWDYTDAIIWSGVEVHTAVIVPCLPAIRSLLSRRCPKIFGIDTQADTNKSYERSRGRDIPRSKSFKMVSITTTCAPGKVSDEESEDGQRFSNSKVCFNLGDQMKGTVHTGITGGRLATFRSNEHLVPEKHDM